MTANIIKNIKIFIKNHFNITVFLALAVVVFSLYGKTLFYDWQYLDDDVLILDKQDYLKLSNIKNIFSDTFFNTPGDSGYRPLLNVSFAADRTFSGLNPLGYHITNILIFLFTIFSVYLLYSYKNNKSWAFVFALIIGVNPMLCATVARVVDRSDSLLTLFSVLSFYFLFRYVEEKNRRIFYLFLHLFLFLSVLFIKEVSVVLPVIFLVFYVFKKSGNRQRQTKNSGCPAVNYLNSCNTKKEYLEFLSLCFLWALCVIVFLLFRKSALNGLYQTSMLTVFVEYLKIISGNLTVLIKYFYNLIFPVTDKLDTVYDISFFIITFLIFMLIFINTKYKNIKLILFAVFSFIILFIPTMIMNNHMHSYFQNRIFLPMVCMYYVLVNCFEKENFSFKKAVVCVLIFIIIFYSSITYFRLNRYQNRWTAFYGELKDTPDSPYINAKFGMLLADAGLFEQAEQRLLTAIKLEPYNYNHYNNLGSIYIKTRRYKEAEKYFLTAYQLNPYDENINYNITSLKNYFKNL